MHDSRPTPSDARDSAASSGLHQGSKYLTFSAAGEMYAIAISTIKEIIEYRAPTDVPMMPDFMRGVINLRGRVVPVIDLCARFSRGRSEPTRRSCFVIVELRHQEAPLDIGVLVDAVRQPGGWKFVPKHAVAAVPVVLAVLWGAASRVMS